MKAAHHNQANALYAAEGRAFKGRLWDADRAPALADCQAIVDSHVHGWTVVRSTGGGACYHSTKTIRLSRRAGLPVLLHELAHAKLARSVPSHGVQFMVTYCVLVERHMGVYQRRRLLKSIQIFQPRGWRQVVELVGAGDAAQAALHSGTTPTKEASE